MPEFIFEPRTLPSFSTKNESTQFRHTDRIKGNDVQKKPDARGLASPDWAGRSSAGTGKSMPVEPENGVGGPWVPEPQPSCV